MKQTPHKTMHAKYQPNIKFHAISLQETWSEIKYLLHVLRGTNSHTWLMFKLFNVLNVIL